MSEVVVSDVERKDTDLAIQGSNPPLGKHDVGMEHLVNSRVSKGGGVMVAGCSCTVD